MVFLFMLLYIFLSSLLLGKGGRGEGRGGFVCCLRGGISRYRENVEEGWKKGEKRSLEEGEKEGEERRGEELG